MTRQCWICGHKAESREHIVKSSDIGQVLGKSPSQIYLNDQTFRNRRVQSKNSRHFKYAPSLCNHCNTTATQPYDRAWEKLSAYLYGLPNLRAGKTVNFGKPFKGKCRSEAIHIHLFFVKLFGCLLADEAPDFDTSSFATAVRTGQSHPRVFLEFGVLPTGTGPASAARTPMIALQHGTEYKYLFWAYHLHKFTVGVSFLAEPAMHPSSMKWHPSTAGKVVKFTALRPNNSSKPTPLRGAA